MKPSEERQENKMNRLPERLQFPGAVDLHVHYREPSTNGSETIASGSLAALVGGYVFTADMSNNPGFPTWTQTAMLDKHQRAKTSHIPIGYYSGSQPDHDNIAELPFMLPLSVGTKFYTSKTTGNSYDFTARDYRGIVEVLHFLDPNKPIMLHAGEDNLEEMIELVSREFEHPLHVCHVNDPDDVKMISSYKSVGLPLTSGVTMHHLVKNSQAVDTEGTFAQMQPPLVPQVDSEQLLYQLAVGEIDVVESDHAPHRYEDKVQAEQEHSTCYGVPGIEFSIPLLLRLASVGKISINRIVEVTSTKPAEILGLNIRHNTVVTWNTTQYRIENESAQVVSGAGWTPYLGMLAGGSVVNVKIAGKQLMQNGKVIARHPRVISKRDDTI